MSWQQDSSGRVQIFFSSAPEDKKLRKNIEQHLSILQRQGFIQSWHEQQMLAGTAQQLERDKRLQAAQIVLLLISAHFMASEQCWKETEQALELSEQGKVHVIPILLKPLSGWQDASFGKLEVLPNNRKPISQWDQKDLAITNIVDGIRLVIEKRRAQQLSEQRQQITWETLIEYPPQPHPGSTQPRKKTVKEVYTSLTQTETTALILTGIAGVGKSTLANLVYHYTETQRQKGEGPFTAETLKLRMHPALTLFTLLETLFTACSEPIPNITHLTAQNLAALLWRFLQTDTHPRLIILDQFEHLLDHSRGEALAEDVKTWLRLLTIGPCHNKILLVSRIIPKITQDNTQDSSIAHVHYYHTEGLELQESIGLLQSWGLKENLTELSSIAEYFSGHALALTLLAPLLSKHIIQVNTIFQAKAPFKFQIEEITRFIERIYIHQLDDTQRALLVAFSVFREPVPLHAALQVMDQPSTQIIHHIQSVLESLLTLHLLQENNHGYQLQSLIAMTAQIYFVPGDPERNKEVRAAAHEKAALYYLQQIRPEIVPQQLRQSKEMHEGMEAAWHLCQAGKWQQAYEVIIQENIFTNLLSWGGSTSLLEIYQQLPLEQERYEKPAVVASLQKDLGEIYHRLGQKQKAQTYLTQARQHFQKLGDIKGEAGTLLLLGEVFGTIDQKDQARECYEKALKLCEENEILVENGLKGIALNNTGKIYHEQGDFAVALNYYNEAISLHTTISEEATTLNNLGGLYELLGKMGNAHRYYQKALRFFQEIGARRGEGSVLHNLGRMYYNEEKIRKAQEHYEQAWHIFYEIGDHWSERITLESLCSIYLVQGYYKAALACVVQIKKIVPEIGDGQRYEMKGVISLLERQFGSVQFAALWSEIAEHNSSRIITDFSDL